MKKTAAILFLFVLLFNLFGYRLLINCIQSGKNTELLTRLDNEDFKPEELVSIKTPIALPYYNNSEAYERVNGTIEIAGTEYKYVKRRIYNDSLELLCLPNTVKQQLQSAKVNFFKLTNEGTTTDGAKKTAQNFKNVLPEYCEALLSYSFTPACFIVKAKPHTLQFLLPAAQCLQQDQPPELA